MVDNQPENLHGISLLIVPAHLTIFSDASKTGWRTSCQEITTEDRLPSVEESLHINDLELKALRLAILSFTKLEKLNSIYPRIGNMIALSYLLNMEDTQNKHLIEILKNLGSAHRYENTFDSRIYTQSEQSNSRLGILILPGHTEKNFCPTVFKQICSHLGKPLFDLFTSKLLPPTVAIHSLATIPLKCTNRCISTGLKIPISVYFSTILNDRKEIKEISKRPDQHDHCYVRLAEPVIVSNPVENGYQKSNYQCYLP